MNQDALIAWTSMYVAVGIMCLLSAVLAVAVTYDDWRTERWRPALESGWQKTLFLPRIWLRWQINYLKGTPVILAIALYYAHSVGWSVFWNI